MTNRDSLTDVLRKLWRGQYSLPTSFWGFYVLGSLFVFAGLGGIILVTSNALQARTIGFIVALMLVTAYWFIAAVGVWRSAAAKTASPTWMDQV